MVASAHTRLLLRRPLTLAALDARADDLIAGLDLERVRQRNEIGVDPQVALAG